MGKGYTIEFSDKDIKYIQEMYAIGLPLKKIAQVLGISVSTIERRRKEDDALNAALEKGRASTDLMVLNNFYKHLKDGDKTALIFYMKTKMGYSEKQILEHQGQDGENIKLEITLPKNGRESK
jgi:hypothetical protein